MSIPYAGPDMGDVVSLYLAFILQLRHEADAGLRTPDPPTTSPFLIINLRNA